MKHWLLRFSIVLLVLFLGAIAFLSIGPLFPPHLTFAAVSIPDDIEAYLAANEARVGTVKPGQEKKIFWADPEKKSKTPIVFVYLHGFSASRGETSPVIEDLAHEFGANLFMTRLTAHGLTNGKEAFAQLTAQDLIHDADEAMAIAEKLGDRVVLVGMSTGAMLALHLAMREGGAAPAKSPAIAAVVILSPNFHPRDWRAKILSGPFGPKLARTFIGETRKFKTLNADHAYFWTSEYRAEGVAAMMDLLNNVARYDLRKIKVPVLTIYTRHDDVIDTDLVQKRAREFPEGSRIIDLDVLPGHMLAGRVLHPESIAILKAPIRDFLRSTVVQ